MDIKIFEKANEISLQVIKDLDLENEQEIARSLSCFYVAMCFYPYHSQEWALANEGWCSVVGSWMEAKRITKKVGGNALDFIDVEKVAELIKIEGKRKGFFVKNGEK